jgi:hypothetical protein
MLILGLRNIGCFIFLVHIRRLNSCLCFRLINSTKNFNLVRTGFIIVLIMKGADKLAMGFL